MKKKAVSLYEQGFDVRTVAKMITELYGKKRSHTWVWEAVNEKGTGSLVFVDCEATGPCPGKGELTEFGAVVYPSRTTFHGVLYDTRPSVNPEINKELGGKHDPTDVFTRFDKWLVENTNGRPIFVSDNPAFDWQWINYMFHHTIGRNPFGHSARRISDFYAGLVGNFSNTQKWKRLRITKHDHNPVNDAMGNLEAFERLQKGER